VIAKGCFKGLWHGSQPNHFTAKKDDKDTILLCQDAREPLLKVEQDLKERW